MKGDTMVASLSLGSEFHFARDFKIIVFTGGPCGGKSTAIEEIKKRLELLGYWVYTLNEVATDIFGSGFRIDAKRDLSNNLFQPFKIELSLAKENCFVKAIQQSVASRKVLLLDGGIMDDLLCTGAKLFGKILRSLGLSMMDVRDRRYDAVFHLETVATLEDARARDKKTLECWIGHRHLRIIPAMIKFKAKIELLWRHVLHVLGIPKPLEIERKFLVELPKDIPVPLHRILVHQAYLRRTPSGAHPRIRRVVGVPNGYHDASSEMMFLTNKFAISSTTREEYEEEISKHRYRGLYARRSSSARLIKKYRIRFVYENQYFELDEFLEPYKNLALLEIELLEEGDSVILPPFVKVLREVTDDHKYKNSSLAKLSLGPAGRLLAAK